MLHHRLMSQGGRHGSIELRRALPARSRARPPFPRKQHCQMAPLRLRSGGCAAALLHACIALHVAPGPPRRRIEGLARVGAPSRGCSCSSRPSRARKPLEARTVARFHGSMEPEPLEIRTVRTLLSSLKVLMGLPPFLNRRPRSLACSTDRPPTGTLPLLLVVAPNSPVSSSWHWSLIIIRAPAMGYLSVL